jgi:metal-responsive CopG/Arc/MetJ family transcriptional regulator
MKTREKIAEHVRAYRQRQSAAGNREVTLNLPREAVDFLDEIKERRGLRNRSQALVQLIEQKGATAQQTT